MKWRKRRQVRDFIKNIPAWRQLIEKLHDDVGLDVWCERIENAVLDELPDSIAILLEECAESEQARARLLRTAGHEKAPMLVRATGANNMERGTV